MKNILPIYYMIYSVIAFSIMYIIVTYLNRFSVYQIVFFRAIGSLSLIIPLILKKKIPILGNNKRLLLLRAILGVFSMTLFFLDCIKAWVKDDVVEIRNPNSTRPWQHVLEPLSGYLHLGEQLDSDQNLNGESFNFGPSSDNTKTVKELLLDLSSFWNLNVKPFNVKNQNKKLKRKNILDVALKNTKLILIHDHKFAAELINFYAPEHYIINTSLNDYFITHVENAGSVFIGQYTPESAGDYASGTNHTLPTNGYAKAYSGVNLDSFQKSITFQSITKQGLESIGPVIELMASAEGLDAHKNAVSIRLKVQDNEFE